MLLERGEKFKKWGLLGCHRSLGVGLQHSTHISDVQWSHTAAATAWQSTDTERVHRCIKFLLTALNGSVSSIFPIRMWQGMWKLFLKCRGNTTWSLVLGIQIWSFSKKVAVQSDCCLENKSLHLSNWAWTAYLKDLCHSIGERFDWMTLAWKNLWGRGSRTQEDPFLCRMEAGRRKDGAGRQPARWVSFPSHG